ncbi:uncharacterized protein RCO7_03840 [Rhynchosporium graminicola]|uniref:MYND-type domain-containing protein n=1 Tax=Rhynchosporium graminicola TaxID=2792576 RepID=A0A1E1LLZ3_9HELO|nr:uncharacterized protein RCO7_03840 [Rhynchosporium commune]
MAPNRCTMCSEPGTKRCGTCLSSFYCSSACQTQDYPLHKLLCKELPTFLANNPCPANINVAHRSDRSDYSPKLGFLFPVNGNKPRLIWVKFKIYRLDNGKIEEVAPDLSEHLESQSSELRTYAEDRLDPVVDLYICKTSFLGREPNQCLHRLLKGYQWTDGDNPIFDTKWAGNVVALRSVLPKSNKDPDGEGERDFEDVTLADLRHALIKLGDETILYESENENRFLPLDPKKWVRGVKISCDGDMMVWGKEKFRNIHVVREDFDPNAEMKAILQGSPEPEKKDISIISSHMGIPLLVSKCKLDHEVVAAFQAGKISLYGNNFDTQALMTNANLAATMNEWGYPGIKWL